MDELRRTQAMRRILGLAVATAVLTALQWTVLPARRTSAGAAVASGPVVIRNLAGPGAFEVENLGPERDLSWTVSVQREQNGGWMDEVTDVELLQKCGETKLGSCMHVPHGAKFHPVPWNGLSCGSQCPASCRANIYLGPGRFRFVLSSCDGKEHWPGPPFDLPSYDERK